METVKLLIIHIGYSYNYEMSQFVIHCYVAVFEINCLWYVKVKSVHLP